MNKEALRKELEDAVNAGIRIKIDGYESHIVKDQLVQDYITTRLAALDDGDGKATWVQASKRLPQMEKILHVKEGNGFKRMGNFFEDDGIVKFSVMGNEAHESFIIPSEHFITLYWLEDDQPLPK